jgi:hypothetical protein
MPSRFRRLTFVESASDPSQRYEIKTDGVTMSCACPRWRFARGGTRDCRHLQEVRTTMEAEHMTLQSAMRFLDLGVDPINPLAEAVRAEDARRVALRAEVEGIFNSTPWRPTFATDRVLAIIERESTTKRAPTPVAEIANRRPAWLGGGRAILLRD